MGVGLVDYGVNMKVVFLPDYSYANPYQRELANALSKFGVDVKMSRGIDVLPLFKALSHWNRVDIFHFHWLHPFLCSRFYIIAVIKGLFFISYVFMIKSFGKKVVWTVHNLMHHEANHPRLEAYFRKTFAHLSDGLIVHCEAVIEQLRQTFCLPQHSINKIHVLHHGNYIGAYENVSGKENSRNRLGIKNEDIVFLYFGMIRPYKGIFRLIEGFEQLKLPDSRLLIVGRPQNTDAQTAIEKRSQHDPRIMLDLRYIPDNEIQYYFNAADVVVLPYEQILTSGTLILALSYAKAVIAPRLGCVPDVLDERGGVLYAPEDDRGVLKAMKTIINADIDKMGAYNHKVAEQLDWDEIGKLSRDLYHQLAKRNR